MHNVSSYIQIIIFCAVSFACKGQLFWRDSIKNISDNNVKLEVLNSLFDKEIYKNQNQSLRLILAYDSIASQKPTTKTAAITENMHGMLKYVNGQFGEALDHFLIAANYFETQGVSKSLARVLNNIATCYQNRSDTAKSTEYFERALSIYGDLQDSVWIGNIHSNLSLQYYNDGALEEAQFHIERAIPIMQKWGSDLYLGIALLNRANLNVTTENLEQAIEDYLKSMELVPENSIPLLYAAANTGLGACYNKLDRQDEALPFLLEGLKKAKSLNHFDQIKESYKELSALYENKGDLFRALHYHKEYTNAKDSAFNISQDAILAETLSKYESEKKEQEIALLNIQNELQDAQLRSSRFGLIGLTVGLVILACLISWLYRLNQKVKKSADEKDTLLREIHHRVKNNLQVISALLTLQSSHLKDAQAKSALQEGQGRVESMALIHKDLYQHDNLKGVNTKEYLEQLTANLLRSYKIDESEVRLNLDIEELNLDVDTMIPMGLMVNELISNALKHAFKKSKDAALKIRLSEQSDQLLMTIADNGKGVADIDGMKKKSFGYSLVQSFARKLDADLQIESKDGLKIDLTIKNYKKV